MKFVSHCHFVTIFIFIINLYPISGDYDPADGRIKRAWLDDLPLPSHQSYLGDVCTNSSKCIVPHSVCVPTDNVYWNRQSFCVCSAGYRPSTGQCIEDVEEPTDKFPQRMTKVVMTKSSATAKPMTTGTETPTELSMLEHYKHTMERNAVTVLPAFFSKLKLSNKTQEFISTMVHQLATYKNSMDEFSNSTQTSQIIPPANRSTICNGIYCSPVLGLIRTEPNVDSTTVSQNYSTTSMVPDTQVGSSLSKNIEGLLANTPTRAPIEINSAKTLSNPHSHPAKFLSTTKSYPIVKTKASNAKEVYLKTSIFATTTTAKPTDLYSYEEEYEVDTTTTVTTTTEAARVTASSPKAPKIGVDHESESNYKYILNPHELSKQIDLYAILKAAAEDVMKQYLGVLLANSTAFPRLWADAKNHDSRSPSMENTVITEVPKTYDGWMRRPVVSAPTLMASQPIPKVTSNRPYLFKIINKSQTKTAKNSLLRS